MKRSFFAFLCLLQSVFAAPFGEPISKSKIKYSFSITGAKTAIFDENCETVWEVKAKSRGEEVLPNENVLVAFANGTVVACQYGSRRDAIPDAIEINPKKEADWEFKVPKFRGLHEIHVLTTNGKPAGGRR